MSTRLLTFCLSPIAQIKQLQGHEIDPTAPRELSREHLTLLDELGKGHFGIVSKGLLKEEKRTPGYLVAVKSLQPRAGSAAGELLEEAAVMAQVCCWRC